MSGKQRINLFAAQRNVVNLTGLDQIDSFLHRQLLNIFNTNRNRL
jgi:anti-anti-sigma regulatory factor